MGRSDQPVTGGQAACEAMALPPGPILLPLDNPDYAGSALQVARIVGRLLGRSLIVAHASNQPLWPAAVLASVGLKPGEAGGSTIVPLAGEPARAVLRLAGEAACGLIVMGLPSPRRGRRGLGQVRQTVLERAPCPVLMVPAGLDQTWGRKGRVLLPHDGTPSTTAAVPLATAFARALGARLVFLHVAAALPGEAGSLAVPMFVDQPQYEWEAWRAEFLARCRCPGAPPLLPEEFELLIGAGAPEEAILATARSCDPDVIVLGWHGHLDRGHAGILKDVLRRSAWPVLVHRLQA